MTPDLMSVDLGGQARLWDQHFNLIATEPCAKPNTDLEVKVRGKGPLHDAVKARLIDGLLDEPLHITYDPNSNHLDDWRNRQGGRVVALEIEEARCECGNDIVTTTIRGLAQPHIDAYAVR